MKDKEGTQGFKECKTKWINLLNKGERLALVQEALQAYGYRDGEIAALMQVNRSRVCLINKKVKEGTLNPLINKARKAVKMILAGMPVGDMKEVRGSDVLTAAKMVLDRSDPIINKIESKNYSFSYELKDEDRDKYRKALGIVDAEFTALPQGQALIEDRKERSDSSPVTDSERIQVTSSSSASS